MKLHILKASDVEFVGLGTDLNKVVDSNNEMLGYIAFKEKTPQVMLTRPLTIDALKEVYLMVAKMRYKG